MSLRRALRTAVHHKYTRSLIAYDGVTDEDRAWWEWHIPARQHKGANTTVLYLDGVGKFTWKHLIERDIFTVEHMANASDEVLLDLEKNGCLNVNVAREHARVFMKTMRERERELQLQQSSWDKEVERLLEERERIAEANRRKWEQSRTEFVKAREDARDEQRETIKKIVEAYDYGPEKLSHQASRFEQETGISEEHEVEAEEPRSGGNPFR
eukprot:TRINITY_DN9657_c0_g1_i2.p2 TRINITY_DN9657_c0_g1~~TRINITY_DN9657_c0_g1_i2.p2  ORF type:complete len:212 (+),score=67.14 TRINITY_DN9657_c0_g1_i2:957-1592(+)